MYAVLINLSLIHIQMCIRDRVREAPIMVTIVSYHNNKNRGSPPNGNTNNNRFSRPRVNFIRAEGNGPRRDPPQREDDREHSPRSNSIEESRAGNQNQGRGDPSMSVRIAYNQQNPPERLSLIHIQMCIRDRPRTYPNNNQGTTNTNTGYQGSRAYPQNNKFN